MAAMAAIFMPPTSKKLEGHITSGLFVNPSFRPSVRSLVVMTGLEKCFITSAYLQWLCHSGERPVARGPLVSSPEHEVLRVSYCDQSMSIVCCLLWGVNNLL